METYKFEYIWNKANFGNKIVYFKVFLKGHLTDYQCFDIAYEIYNATYNESDSTFEKVIAWKASRRKI